MLFFSDVCHYQKLDIPDVEMGIDETYVGNVSTIFDAARQESAEISILDVYV